jgi:hypothetical protein
VLDLSSLDLEEIANALIDEGSANSFFSGHPDPAIP